MKLELSRHIFEKCSNIKFHENPSSGGEAEVFHEDGQTDMNELTVAFLNLANAPKNSRILAAECSCVFHMIIRLSDDYRPIHRWQSGFAMKIQCVFSQVETNFFYILELCVNNLTLQRLKKSICGNKMPTRCIRWFLLQILLLAQHAVHLPPCTRNNVHKYRICCHNNIITKNSYF